MFRALMGTFLGAFSSLPARPLELQPQTRAEPCQWLTTLHVTPSPWLSRILSAPVQEMVLRRT